AHIPYTGEPISGVKYTIKEYRAKKGGGIGEIEYTDFELEGSTNANGIAEISFFPKKKLDYMYRIYFDYSNIQFQNYSGSYSLINAPSYDLITRKEPRDYEIRALPLMQINYKLENVNCSGASDSMRIILRNIDEDYYVNINNEQWSPYAIGCYSNTNQIEQGLAGRYVYKIQVIRNGSLTEYIDTILIAPGVNDNLFIEY
ncbi:hypothetical protein, partial [Fluviicola sp.]|uniref:hypothetical protein n=1 Tax=Fluviicola sp. TaxID=1917219 RepID=UPI00260A0A2F